MPQSRPPSLADQQRFWENQWLEKKSTTSWALKRGEEIVRLIRSLSLNNPKILDFGCGTGWFTERLAHFGPATGIDLSDRAIAAARSRFPHVAFLAGNLFEIPLPADSFDVIVSQQVIAHVQDQSGYVERAAHTLKPGGHLILTTPNKFVMDRLDWDPEPAEHIEHWLTMRHLKRLLRGRFRVLHATSLLPIGHRGIFRLINSYKLNATISFVIPRRHLGALKERAGLGYTLIVLAQKRR